MTMRDEYQSNPDYGVRRGPLYQHPEDCNCEPCHLSHQMFNLVESYANDPLYQCCKDQIEEEIMKGDRCREHGAGDMLIDGRCGLCLQEQKGAA